MASVLVTMAPVVVVMYVLFARACNEKHTAYVTAGPWIFPWIQCRLRRVDTNVGTPLYGADTKLV